MSNNIVPSPQKRRKLHAIFHIDHVLDDFMVVQNGFSDIQPQAAAAAVPVPGFVHPIERSEDTLQIFLRNVDAEHPYGTLRRWSPGGVEIFFRWSWR